MALKENVLEGSHIVLKRESQLRPDEIDLGYLANDEGCIDKINNHDYDIQLDNIKLDDVDDKNVVEKLLKIINEEGIKSLDRIYNLRLLRISKSGMNLESRKDNSLKAGFTFINVNKIITACNKAIEREVNNNSKRQDQWYENFRINLRKYDEAQCSTRVGLKGLREQYELLKDALNAFDATEAKIELLTNEASNKLQKAKIRKKRRINKKLKKQISKLRKGCLTELRNAYLSLCLSSSKKESATFNMSTCKEFRLECEVNKEDTKYFSTKHMHDNQVNKLISEYRYAIGMAYLFLDELLLEAKKHKVKRLIKLYELNIADIRCSVLKKFEEKYGYDYAYEVNGINCLDHIVNLTVVTINMLIDRNILLRRRVDAVAQITPVVLLTGVYVLAYMISIHFNYTLLKRIDGRWLIGYILLVLLGFAIAVMINHYRNTIRFKRPKRGRFTLASLISYAAVTAIFLSLNTYFILRYDGYDNYYYYVDQKNNEIKIDGIREDRLTFIVPESIDNKRVAKVSNLVFRGKKSIKTIDFTSCTGEIDDKCFKNATSLVSISFNEKPMDIPASAFEGCRSLVSCDGLVVKSIGKAAFKECKNLEGISLSEDMTSIGSESFENCQSLRLDRLPNGIKAVGKNAFLNCQSIESMVLSDGVERLDKSAFKGCKNIKRLQIVNLDKYKDFNLLEAFSMDVIERLEEVVVNKATRLPNGFLKGADKLLSITVAEGLAEIGNEAFNGCKSLRAASFTGEINTLGEAAFKDCTSLSTLNIDLRVKRINPESFKGCRSLPGIVLPENLESIGKEAFKDCELFSKLELPRGCSEIGNEAFNGCRSLRELTIGRLAQGSTLSNLFDKSSLSSLEMVNLLGVNEIQAGFFAGCTGLNKVNSDSTISLINDNAFNGCILLNDFSFIRDVKKIGAGAFKGSGITTIDFKNNISVIPNDAFSECPYLYEITLPKTITEIGDRAFAGSANINSVVINSSNVSLGKEAFMGANSISSITMPLIDGTIYDIFGERVSSTIYDIKIIPNEKTEIANGMFKNLSSLQRLDIPNRIYKIGDEAFMGCSELRNLTMNGIVANVGNRSFKDCYRLTSFSYLGSLDSIGEEAFSQCYRMPGVSISNNVKAIPARAFYGCESLDAIILPDSVKEIGENAYFGCHNIYKLVLNEHISSINDGAFFNCVNLTDITIPAVPGIAIYRICNVEHIRNITALILDGNIPDELFFNCISAVSIDLVGTVKKIGARAFKNCIELKNVAIPYGVEEIGDEAYYNCRGLNEIRLSSSFSKLGKKAFYQCPLIRTVEMPIANTKTFNDVISDEQANNIESFRLINAKKILKHYFEGFINLTSFDLTGVEEIEDKAFVGTGLQHIVLPKSLKKLGKKVFDSIYIKSLKIENPDIDIDRESFLGTRIDSLEAPILNMPLKDVIMPKLGLAHARIIGDNINIPEDYFKEQFSLEQVEIDGSINSIGKNAFYSCNSLTTLYLGENKNVLEIAEGAFGLCHELKSTGLASAKIIGKNAFSGCFSLNDGRFISGASEIGENAFNGCAGLESIELGAEIERIKVNAFNGCYGVSRLLIPANIRSIDNYGFGSMNLTDLTIENPDIKIAERAFENTQVMKMYAPILDYRLADIFDQRSITYYKILSSDSVTIPDGYFIDCSGLGIVDAKGYSFFGCEAFKNCISLTSLFANSRSNGVVIGKEAFLNCGRLNTLEIGGASFIDDFAFANCTNLESIEFLKAAEALGKAAFENCYSIVSVELPNSITEIPDRFFNMCSGLRGVNIPDSVTRVGEQAFASCMSLRNFTIGKNIKEFGNLAFDGIPLINDISINVPGIPFVKIFGEAGAESIEEIELKLDGGYIPNQLFMNLVSLKRVSFIGELNSIGDLAFANCYSLNDIHIPADIERIGSYAFANCKRITRVLLNNPNLEIGDGVFYGADALSDLTVPLVGKSFKSFVGDYIPESLTNVNVGTSEVIPAMYFKDCSFLTEFDFTNVRSIGDYAFEGTSLHNIELGEGVKEIGKGAFKSCFNLVSVVNNTNLDTIPEECFYSSERLASVYGNASLKTIEEKAFKSCTELETIENIGNVLAYKDEALAYCSSLAFKINGDVEEIGSRAFYGAKVPISMAFKNPKLKLGKEITDDRLFEISINQASINEKKGLAYHFGKHTLECLKNLKITAASDLNAKLFKGLESLEAIFIDGNVKVGNDCFKNMKALNRAVMTEVTEVGRGAFNGCESLITVLLGDNITRIGANAFNSCYSLDYIELPDDIEYIGSNAIEKTTNIKSKLVNEENFNFNYHSNGRDVLVLRLDEAIKANPQMFFIVGCALGGLSIILFISLAIIAIIAKIRANRSLRRRRSRRH